MHALAAALAILVACGSPQTRRATDTLVETPTDPWARAQVARSADSGPPADAGTPVVRVSHDASVAAAPPIVSNVACPPARPRTATAATPRPGAAELDVWRSREQLPACLAPHIPADVDFSREMIAARLPPSVHGIEIRTPATQPARSGDELLVEAHEELYPCPTCRGAVDRLTPVPTRPPTRVWRLPLVTGVHVFLRVRPHPHQPPCPPCTAP